MTEERRPRQGSRPIPNEEGLEQDPPDAVTSRVPYDAAAEEALLGAALISGKALAVLATETRPEDFYVPTHRKVAEALSAAFEAGQAVDVVTIAHALDKAGHLDGIGGPGTLIAIQAATPSTTSAPRYAEIVHDAATLRRLYAASHRIGDLAVDGADAHEAVAAARAALEDVAQQNGARTYSSLDVADVEALLAGDLEPEEATILTRSDGRALFYPGKMHMIQAEPSAGKTWVALAACLEILALGGSAFYLDFEDTAKGVLGRLLALGADPKDVVARFQYAHPSGPFTHAEKVIFGQILRDLNPDLVVIDGVAEALTREGLSEDSASDVVGWIDRVPRWITRTGAAVVMLDHVTKDPEQRGRYARGSGAKLATIDGAAYSVKTLNAFSRTKDGLLRFVVAKDRPGGIGAIGDTAAMISVAPHADGARVILKVEPDTGPASVADAWRPTHLMARVSKEVAESATPLTARALRSMIHAEKPKFVSEAIARLLAEGYLREARQGSATVLVSVRPFDETTPRGDEPPLEDRTDLPAPEPLPLDVEDWKRENF